MRINKNLRAVLGLSNLSLKRRTCPLCGKLLRKQKNRASVFLCPVGHYKILPNRRGKKNTEFISAQGEPRWIEYPEGSKSF